MWSVQMGGMITEFASESVATKVAAQFAKSGQSVVLTYKPKPPKPPKAAKAEEAAG